MTIEPNKFNQVYCIFSGKGGVGKSSVCSQLALSLVNKGFTVGVLDCDLTGPSIPKIFGLENHQVYSLGNQNDQQTGWLPVQVGNLKVMSLGFLVEKQDPIIWRGPKKNAMIKQFVENVQWGSCDYLFIDTPPGTSDEHLSIIEFLHVYAPKAILVTTPQAVSISDVRKQVSFCKKVNIPIHGVIENMSGYVCPHCQECSALFSQGGGEAMALDLGIPFLCRIPIDPQLSTIMESNDFINAFKSSSLSSLFESLSL